jgi:hypothetical protein
MFIITKDVINNGEHKQTGFTYISTRHPVGSVEYKALHARLLPKCIHKFRLLDDDQNVYLHGISTSNDDNRAFIPLDIYQQDLGCTDIQYFNNGLWESL